MNEYYSATEIAQKWGISGRRVGLLCAQGRILGATKIGKTWLIPADAEKPGDPRFEKKQTPQKFAASGLAFDLAAVLEAIKNPVPLDDPDMILNYIEDESIRFYVEGAFAYHRGDFEKAKLCCGKIGGGAVKLLSCTVAIAASVSTGDDRLHQEMESWLKDIIKAGMGEDVTAVAELMLSTAYVGAFAPDMIPDWLKNGDFSVLPPPLRPEAVYQRTRYFHFMKKYESLLDTARTALAFIEPVQGFLEGTPYRGLSFQAVYLRVMCAASCCSLGLEDDAKKYLRDAMDIALPRGFIMPFSVFAPLFGGLLERLLMEYYPDRYDAVTGLAKHAIPNWLAFHNRVTKNNITQILSLREYEIARYAAQGYNDKQIGIQVNLAAGTVKNIVDKICAELLLSGRNRRKALAKYIL